MFVFVEEGTVNADNGFVLTTNDAGYDRLPIGTADQILTVQSGTLAYTSTLDGGTF